MIKNKEKDGNDIQKMLDTRESFEYQWKNIPEGAYLLSDGKFRENVDKILLDEMNMSRDRFGGSLVLDAGCGNGRWTYGFLKLGCQVVALDYTWSGCIGTKNNTRQFRYAHIILADILHMPLRRNVFDIVFCWGCATPHWGHETRLPKLNKCLKKGRYSTYLCLRSKELKG